MRPTELVTKVKPNIDSVDVHPQLSNNRHPVDGALVGAGSLWPRNSYLHMSSNVYQQQMRKEDDGNIGAHIGYMGLGSTNNLALSN